RRGLTWIDTTRSLPGCFEFIERSFELHLEIFIKLFFLADRSEQAFFPRLQIILQLALEFFYAVDRNRIEISVLHGPHYRDLFLDRDWIVLFLLKKLDNALTTIETRLCRRIKIGAKLRECGQ